MDIFHHCEYRLAAQTSHPTTNPSPHLDSATPPQPVDLAAPPFQAKQKMGRQGVLSTTATISWLPAVAGTSSVSPTWGHKGCEREWREREERGGAHLISGRERQENRLAVMCTIPYQQKPYWEALCIGSGFLQF